jgi:hypothetical protein
VLNVRFSKTSTFFGTCARWTYLGEYVNNLLVILILTFLLADAAHASAPEVDPRKLIEASAGALGGRERLLEIHSIRVQANAHRNLLEQSARPEWPWISDYYRLDLTLQFEPKRLHAIEYRDGRLGWLEAPQPDRQKLEYWVADEIAMMRAGGLMRPYSQAIVQDTDEWMALNPLRLLITASQSDTIRREGDQMFQGMQHHVVSFSWNQQPVSILINARTMLPSAVTWLSTRPRDIFWSAWGDVTTRIRFANWNLRPTGIRFPTQWVVERNDLPDRTFEITSLTVNPDTLGTEWTVPESVRDQVRNMPQTIADLPLGLAGQPSLEIAPGIVRIPGRWDVTIVRQDDGIVIIEAPISSSYSELVLAEARRRFPGLPIKAVVSTSDAWPHIAGIRTYVAQGIPLYILDLNLAIVQRLLSARFSVQPDALAAIPSTPSIKLVESTLKLGTGDNALTLIPLRTAVGERQMIIDFPARRLAYTSDVVQQGPAGDWYAPEMLLELSNVFRREAIEPEECFGMHYGLTAWHKMRNFLTDYLSISTPHSTP